VGEDSASIVSEQSRFRFFEGLQDACGRSALPQALAGPD